MATALNKFCSIRTANGVYTEFGIAPREALIDLVDHIKVYENGNISVKCKFADEFRKIAEYIEINTSEIPAVAG